MLTTDPSYGMDSDWQRKYGSEPEPQIRKAASQTDEEIDNISVAKEYIKIAYSPTKNQGRSSVQHLCTPDSWFWSPSTFPGCTTPLDYADAHAHVMESVSDLRVLWYDQMWAKHGHVFLRYTAEGSHCGKPYQGIEKSDPPRKAIWSAAAIFEVENGKIKCFTKEWDQKAMQIQLGWAPVGDSEDPRWNRDLLGDPERARTLEW